MNTTWITVRQETRWVDSLDPLTLWSHSYEWKCLRACWTQWNAVPFATFASLNLLPFLQGFQVSMLRYFKWCDLHDPLGQPRANPKIGQLIVRLAPFDDSSTSSMKRCLDWTLFASCYIISSHIISLKVPRVTLQFNGWNMLKDPTREHGFCSFFWG